MRRIFFHPLAIDLTGDHPIANWLQKFFGALAGDHEQAAHLSIRFVNGRLPTASGKRSFQFDGRFFRCLLETSDSPWKLTLASPRGRSCWPQTFRKPGLAWKTWLSHGTSLDVLRCKELVYQILPFVAHCRLLELGAAIIHASCFACQDRAILLPALGGVGKSAVMTSAVLGGQARFLADDLLVIDRTGQVYFSPIPIHYYSYHLDNNQQLTDRVLPRGRLQWRIAKSLYPKRAVRWTSPFDIWKPEELAGTSARLGEVFFMRRHGGQLQCEPLSAERIAHHCTRVIFGEIGHMPDRLAAAGAEQSGHPALPNLAEIWEQTEAIYRDCFSTATKTAGISIPRSTSPPELYAYFGQVSDLLTAAADQ